MSPAQPPPPTTPLDAHLPLDRRHALSRRQELPAHDWGTALFADISGFTPLMERLASTLGPREGAEALTLLLNALFTPLIAEIHRHGGSIIAFGGDALTCWFPARSPSHKAGAAEGDRAAGVWAAAHCALALQRHVVARGPMETPAGPVTLAMRIGAATGAVRRLVVGRPPYGLLDVLAGATVDRMAEAQNRADTGHVVVDAATAAALPANALLPLGEGFFILGELDAAALPAIPPVVSTLPTRQVRPWLAEPLYRRLRVGHGALTAELRLVTAIFVNLSGLDYDTDPAAGDKLQQYVVRAEERLAPYEGHLAAVTCGDKGTVLYILLGAPIAHEDDPARAIGFALALREAAHELPFTNAQRIGISLGRAYAGILGSAERCTYSVLGDEVNTSARLMQAAQPGQILVSRPAQRAAVGRYAFRPLGTIALKGKEEAAPIFEPLAAQARRPAAAAEEALIGRSAEKQALAEIVAQLAAGRGGVLLVQGEAGIGKSALVRYLLQQVRGHGWSAYVGGCLSYGRHIPYLPWRLLLEEIYRLDPARGPAERAAHLEEVVAGLPDPAGRPGYWRARLPLFAAAMGLEVPDTPLTQALEGELRRDNTFQLLEALVRAPAAAGPAVIVLEDAYWADELSLQLAAHIARGLRDLPLLLAVVQRPLDREAPAVASWEHLPSLVSLSLEPLESAAAQELARRRLDTEALPPEIATLLQEKAQGNPFFVEELVRALQESACIQRSGDTVQLCGDWQEIQLPDTIAGVVQARLDRLPEEDHLTLKVSSVIGRAFERPLLRAVHPSRLSEGALARQLDRLEEAAIVMLEEPAAQWRYAFQHPILHEVTYSTLLFAQRRQLHGEIGSVLEAWHAGELPRVINLLAYHYAHSEARAKAVHYLQRAAEKARREYANEVALAYYSQALERLLPGEDGLRYDLLAGRERIHDLLGEREAQEEDLLELGQLAEDLEDIERQVEVLNRRARRAADTGAFDDGMAWGQHALEMAQAQGDLQGKAEAYSAIAILLANAGKYDAARDTLQNALETYRIVNQPEGELTCLGNLGLLSLYQGNMEESRRFYHQALEMAALLSDRRREGRLLLNLGLTYRARGDYDESRVYSEQAMVILREIGDLPGIAINLDSLGAIALAQGDLEAAPTHLQQALDLARRFDDREGEATILCSLGLLHTYKNQVAQARRNLRASLRLFYQIRHRRGQADALHNLGVLELQSGQSRAACILFRRALQLRQEIGETGNALSTRAWLGLANLAANDRDQAQAQVEQVRTRLEGEGYSGDSPAQEVWWAVCQVWRGVRAEERARQALQRAHELVQEQAGRIGDPARRQSFVERIPVNRAVVEAWALEVESWNPTSNF